MVLSSLYTLLYYCELWWDVCTVYTVLYNMVNFCAYTVCAVASFREEDKDSPFSR